MFIKYKRNRKGIRKLMIYIFIIISSVSFLAIAYLYLNPSIDNEDFDLEYEVSRGKKEYFEVRNKNYADSDYNFNNLKYCNHFGISLILHSLDKESDGKEKVIFVLKDPQKKFSYTIIDYFDTKTNFNIFKIEYLADSVYIWKKRSVVQEKEELFFKGKKCK